jgi:son of sevenless-like protein
VLAVQLYNKPKKPSRPTGAGKLIHLLGDDYADKLAAESQPWYLRANYNPSEIVIEEADGSVKGGTRAALVEKLTAHDKVGEYGHSQVNCLYHH